MGEYRVVNQLNHFIESCNCVPLEALRMSARRKISGLMESDINNGFDILANMVGFDVADINIFQRQRLPTIELLHAWTYRKDLRPTIDVFLQLLLKMKRLDVLTSCMHVITKDVQRYRKDQQTESYRLNLENEQIVKDVEAYKRVQRDIQTGLSNGVDIGPRGRFQNTPRGTAQRQNETSILSVDEANDAAKGAHDSVFFWDAFVIYNPEKRDLNFVKKMADILEGPEYNLKLFIPWRDDLPGSARHEVSAELIEKRCRRALVILSTEFHNSSVADFQLKFAQCLSPGARSKKVVPIRINMCNIPSILKIVTICDFTKEETIDWAWPRLAAVIQSPLNPSPEQYALNPNNLKDIILDTSSGETRMWWSSVVALTPLQDE